MKKHTTPMRRSAALLVHALLALSPLPLFAQAPPPPPPPVWFNQYTTGGNAHGTEISTNRWVVDPTNGTPINVAPGYTAELNPLGPDPVYTWVSREIPGPPDVGNSSNYYIISELGAAD